MSFYISEEYVLVFQYLCFRKVFTGNDWLSKRIKDCIQFSLLREAYNSDIKGAYFVIRSDFTWCLFIDDDLEIE